MNNRNSGILLHITSLPGIEGIGTLGSNAYQFVDFLNETGQKLWQILPLGPVGYGNSPYQCYSAFAGNPMLIDLKVLVEEGMLSEDDLKDIPNFVKERVEFDKIEKWKIPLLKKAFYIFQNSVFENFSNAYFVFLDEHGWWLNDHALFMSTREHFEGKLWMDWDDEIKFRKSEELQQLGEDLANELNFNKFLQFLFFRQWHRLKRYANSKNIEIVGDLPLYVSADSSDVWANTDIFLLNNDLRPTVVGGVPPDYFSETGQLWGNPVYDWTKLKEREYDWWIARLHFNLRMFDLVRIDHFRGLEAFWAVSSDEENAINGKWLPAHGHELLAMLKGQIGELPFIAEDLGIITPEVDRLRENFDLPGMKVLQFAFSNDAANADLPHNYSENFVTYTGTHDNNTTMGWLESLSKDEEKMVEKYIRGDEKEGLSELVEMAMASVAKTAIIPMQDILELGADSRMNTPGIATGNWDWRFQWKQLKQRQKKFLEALTEKYNR